MGKLQPRSKHLSFSTVYLVRFTLVVDLTRFDFFETPRSRGGGGEDNLSLLFKGNLIIK